jgi:hypothetical protein
MQLGTVLMLITLDVSPVPASLVRTIGFRGVRDHAQC